MTTPYEDIFDLFMMQVEDYRLVELFQSETPEEEDEEAPPEEEPAPPNPLSVYLTGFLILAISEFPTCTQDLSNRDDEAMEFLFDMSEINKKILSKLMVKEWLGKELKDILQMRWNITDHDFKHYSEAQNTKSKSDVLEILREECSQMIMEYDIRNNDWDAWRSGNFMGG